MKILVTFAVEEEFGPWRGRHRFESVHAENDLTLHQARLGDAEVTVLLTDIGPRVAAANVIGALMSRTFDACISTGLAGALRPGYDVDDILAARTVAPRNEETHPGLREIVAHSTWLDIAKECGATIAARFMTCERIIPTAQEKQRLAPHADAVEMESFEILTEAAAWGVSGISIRAVGDIASEDLPLDFNRTITPHGKVSTARLLAVLLEKPSALPGLIRFARQSRDAAIALADYLDRFVVALATRHSAGALELDEVVAAT